jgi:hypothetical protein
MALKIGDDTGVIACGLVKKRLMGVSSFTTLFRGICRGDEAAPVDADTSLDPDWDLGEDGGW